MSRLDTDPPDPPAMSDVAQRRLYPDDVGFAVMGATHQFLAGWAELIVTYDPSHARRTTRHWPASGLGFAAGGPVGALLQGGLAFANALFVNPEPQAGPSREGLPNEAFTSQDPVHGWDLIGAGAGRWPDRLRILAYHRRQ